jgi:PST family polysaccharide transporter
MGFIILARGERKLFFWSEVLTNIGYVALVWIAVRRLGLAGTGVAFFVLYALNGLAVYIIVRKLTGFRWSLANKQLALFFTPLIALVFVSWYFLPPAGSGAAARALALCAGGLIAAAAGVYSLRILCRLIPAERLPLRAQKMFRLLKLMPSNSH